VMAVAGMVTTILSLLSDIGLTQNIVQSRRGDDPAYLDTAWVVQIVRGVLLWLLAVLLSIALYVANVLGTFAGGSVYSSPELPSVIAVSAFAAVILGFQSTAMATAYRSFDQKRLTQIALISQLASLTVMIAIGVATRSIWALVAGGLIASLCTTILSHIWMHGRSNRFRCERGALQELLHFGKWVFVSSTVGVFAANGDRLLLAGLVDAEVLGLYAIALLIIGAIQGGMTRLFSTVSLPALSETARDDRTRLRRVYYKLRLPGDLLLLFITGAMFAAGQWIVELLYDPRYAGAGRMLEVLALSLVTVRYGVAHQIYLALGLPRYLAAINVTRLVSLYLVVPTLYYLGGTEAAIWGIALHSLAAVPLDYRFSAVLGLNDFRRESLVLIALPIGFLCGSALNMIGA